MILKDQNQMAEEARNFLCGYQLCLDMLKLRKYERKRAKAFEEACECADILSGDEAYWKARIYEVATLLGNMKNSREKMVLYYRYVRGESLESAARLMGISRRTAYRLWHRGLFIAGEYLQKRRTDAERFLMP